MEGRSQVCINQREIFSLLQTEAVCLTLWDLFTPIVPFGLQQCQLTDIKSKQVILCLHVFSSNRRNKWLLVYGVAQWHSATSLILSFSYCRFLDVVDIEFPGFFGFLPLSTKNVGKMPISNHAKCFKHTSRQAIWVKIIKRLNVTMSTFSRKVHK